jgi:hypothetical protein
MMLMMIVVIINIMSMVFDYVSELRSPTGLLFIPYVICEYGEPWLNGFDRGKLLIRPPDFCSNPTSGVIY